MTLLRLSLRLHRSALVWMGALLALVSASQGVGYAKVAGATEQTRAQFARALEPIGRQFAMLLPAPTRAETFGGFLQWRAFGTFALVFAFWAVLAGAGATRGEEDRGLTEQWLGAGRSRRAVLVTRAAGFALASSAVVALCASFAWLGGRAAGFALEPAGLLAQALALEALTLCCFALTAALAQLARERSEAAGLAGVVVGGLFLLNSVARARGGLEAARWLSPFWHYERTRGVTPGGAVDAASIAALFVSSAALVWLAGEGFARRDLNEPLVRLRAHRRATVRTPSRNPLVHGTVRVSLYEQRVGLAVWALSAAALGAGFASLAENMARLVALAPQLAAMFRLQGSVDPARAFVAYAFGGAFELLVALFAVGQVGRWVRDELEGRLELVLSTPLARRRVVLARVASLAAASTLVAGAAVASLGLAAARAGLPLELASMASAVGHFTLLSLLFGALGAAVASFAPRAAVPAVGGFAVASYLVQQLGPMFGAPTWLTRRSVFGALGAPLVGSTEPRAVVAFAVCALAGFAVAARALERRDLGR